MFYICYPTITWVVNWWVHSVATETFPMYNPDIFFNKSKMNLLEESWRLLTYSTVISSTRRSTKEEIISVASSTRVSEPYSGNILREYENATVRKTAKEPLSRKRNSFLNPLLYTMRMPGFRRALEMLCRPRPQPPRQVQIFPLREINPRNWMVLVWETWTFKKVLWR